MSDGIDLNTARGRVAWVSRRKGLYLSLSEPSRPGESRIVAVSILAAVMAARDLDDAIGRNGEEGRERERLLADSLHRERVAVTQRMMEERER